MISFYSGKDFERTISFLSENGENLGFPMYLLQYWFHKDSKLTLAIGNYTIELEGLNLSKIIQSLEMGEGFKILQVGKRFLQNNNEGEPFVWGMSFNSN